MAGNAKTKVLPLPVNEIHIRSRPERTQGKP